jgi:predicted nucleic acid-binding protein
LTFVLDASTALSWCFEDEATPEGDALLERLQAEFARVPNHWALEIANSLIVAERRHRLDAPRSERYLTVLSSLDIRADASTTERAFGEVFHLARDARLTSYDAAYLDLALREGLPLATRDSTLAAAARRAGVDVIEG